MKHVKLFIPGPVEVSKKTFEAFCRPMIGHRSQDFKDLYSAIQPQLQQLFFTQQPVYLSTSSAWGVMEGAIRNLVAKKVLICMNGAFSDKWYDVALRCGKQAEKCQVDWGQPILPEQIEAKLKQGGFDAVTLIHNETSTGTMSPLADICAVVKQFPEVCLIVDAVSSFSAVPIEFDQLGMDVLLTGSQKALALPPGLSLFALSPRALERAAQVKERGYYFDFLEFQKNGAESMTPSTPSIGHIYALQSKLDDIFSEGLENRYMRHMATNRMVHEWAKIKDFALFPRSGYESFSLTCLRNDCNIDLPVVLKTLRSQYGFAVDGGYGKVKGKTFRISNMGDETVETMQELLQALNQLL
ncbi:MAG: alanine--glyoxylate aminotransferase family protein [Verrucomicrobiae bacterium]|nr:alanine--glyoxylate aminotransferase family protein [Verrucomicrobiae bacterium]